MAAPADAPASGPFVLMIRLKLDRPRLGEFIAEWRKLADFCRASEPETLS
jgi:hypothetical protein